MKHPKTPEQVEKDLNQLFKKYGIERKITSKEIKQWIWNASGPAMEALNKYHKKCLQLFPEPNDIDELNDIMQVFTDAWNYFSHKELNGKAPNDLMNEAMENASKDIPVVRSTPKVIVGNVEMEWDEYQEMLKEMEREQKPFKKWIDKDAMPKYQKFLEQTVKNKKIREELYYVAEMFLRRVLHVGFTNFQEIRSSFVQKEFPCWWPTHIMYSSLEPNQVKESLKKFFEFIELVYSIDMIRYGFK